MASTSSTPSDSYSSDENVESSRSTSPQSSPAQDWYVDPVLGSAQPADEGLSLEDQATAFLENFNSRSPEKSHVVGQDISVESSLLDGVKAEQAEVIEMFAPSPVKEDVQTNDAAVMWMELLSDFADNDDDGELAWQANALCAQTDPEAFFPEKGGSTRDAKRVCSACPVSAQCLEYALANDERFGIWGGMSERERRRLRKNR